MKRRLSIIFYALLFPVATIWASSHVWNDGTCTLTLDDEGTMTVSGYGSMKNYANSSSYTPWASYLSSINKVVISSGVTSIGSFCFQGCSSLATIEIGSSVKTIGNYAFNNCDALSSISIPDNVRTIGDNAFSSSSMLAIVEIGGGVTSIGIGAFSNCPAMSSFTISPGNSSYTSRDNSGAECNAIIDKRFGRVYFQQGFQNSRIPEGVTEILDYAFSGCSGLTTINIPSTVTKIDKYAFRGCTNLESINLPNSLTDIGGSAFMGCTNLESINIPKNVTYISDFAFENCTNLASATIWAPSLGTYGYMAFSGCSASLKIYVIGDCVQTYKDNWSSYESQITSIANPDSQSGTEVNGKRWSTYYNGNANVEVDENTTIYTVNLSGTTVSLSALSNKIIKAGQAVVLNSTTTPLVLEYTGSTTSDDYSSNSLLGSDTSVSQDGVSSYYGFANKTNGLGFYKVGSGVSIPANKAYLIVAAGGARDFYLFDEDATGINKVESEKITEGEYYNLAGQRVVQPTKEGCYIMNGKKIIIK